MLFGHVYHSSVDAVVRRTDMVLEEGSNKGSGRPKLTIEAVVKKKVKFVGHNGTRCPRHRSMEKTDSCSLPRLIGTEGSVG